ncbi:uncharacterized protein [Branchiostoma lanceolatum]|uniref:uncharacterized protein isoform X2 n=1 Tax=Branchiostoma lanceolatum TaxID=7740 RepID=UPI0034548F8C
MISMAGPRMLLLAGVNLLIIFHLCQAQTAPAITTNMVTKAETIATTGPATGLITGTGASSRATTDAATTAITTNMVTKAETIATTGPATGLITSTTGAATTGATSRATTDSDTTGATSRITTGAATTADRTDASAADVPTTKNPQTTKEASTKSTTTTAAATTDVVTSKVTTQTAQEANTDSNDTATTTDADLNNTDGVFPTDNSITFSTMANSTTSGNFTTNSTATPDGGSTLEQHEVAIIAASIILVFLLCTGCCLFLLSDWSCTQPKQAKGEPGCCLCNCFSQQEFGNTSSGFSAGKSESHESLEMETTRVTEVGSFTNTSTLHWSTANHHSFHKTEDPENRGNHFRGVIAMISDDGDATRSKKYSEAINLDIFQRGEDDTGGDSLAGDEVSDTSNHTLVTVVSVHTHDHNERSSQRSSNSDPAADTAASGSNQDTLAPEQTVPKKSQGRKRGVFMSDSDVSEGGKNRSYSQSVAEAMRTFDSTALAHYNEEEEHKDSMMTTEL